MLRRTILFLLVVALGFGVFQAWPREMPFERHDELLRERVAQYQELRMSNDWAKMYEITSPGDRKRVSLADYLQFYGHGVFKVHTMTPKTYSVAKQTREAVVDLEVDQEVLVNKLPAQYRTSLRMDDRAQLRQTSMLSLHWIWNVDNWYLQMDPEIRQGKMQGQEIHAVQPVDDGSEGS